jgi:LacI family transcriptional regulator
MSVPDSPPTRSVSLRDIANELNVSVSLVSKVLSGRLGTSGANASKIQAIHAKARELDYRKNQMAQALRTGRQNVFAVYIHRHGTSSSGIVEATVAGIAEAAAEHLRRLVIHYYESPEEFRRTSPDVHRGSADGVIVAGIAHPELIDDLKELHGRGLPIVTLHDQQLDDQILNVGMDQSQVTRLATLHLIGQGCRRIAHFRVTRTTHTNLPMARYDGYCNALAERNIAYLPELVVEVPDFSFEQAEPAVRALIDSGIEFDGVVGQSDEQAVASINALLQAGQRVPDDVRVIGVDNAPFCRLAIVPLSSVSQESRNRGRHAVQMLVRLQEGQTISSMQVDPVIHVRRSTL